MHKTVKEVMHRGVVTCRVSSTVGSVAGIMIDNDVSAAVVVDERVDACGVVTKTDLLKCYGRDLASLTAEDIMTPTLLIVSPETLLHEAVQMMLAHRVHQLVIVTQAAAHRRPVGILTSGDVVSLMAGVPGPRSAAQIQCSECIRKLLSADGCEVPASRPEAQRKGSE